VLSTIAFSAVYPVGRKYQPKFAFDIGRWIIGNSQSYFSFKVEFESYEEVNDAGPSIFVLEPHGVFPVTLFWGSLNLLPKQKILCCLSSSIFLVPMAKHILTWAGAISADKSSIIKHLKQDYSVTICPGGVQEVRYLGNKNECVMYLKSRVGVVKLALEQGVPMIPVVTFGLQNTYDFWVPEHPIMGTIGSYLGFYPMIFFGVFGIPFGQAKPCHLNIIIGTPIKVPRLQNPSTSDIEKYQKLLLSAIEELYNSNKKKSGMEHIKLRIV
jgi:hypothetical protein